MTLGENYPSYAGSYFVVGIRTNRQAESLYLMKQAAAIDHRITGQIFSIGSEKQRMSFLQLVPQRFHLFLSLVQRLYYTKIEFFLK